VEGEQDKNRKRPQIPQSQTASGVADVLDLRPIGPGAAASSAKLELTCRPLDRDIWRGGRAIQRIAARAPASDGGAAAQTGIIAARGLDHGELIASDRLTARRSLMLESIVAPRQEKWLPICLSCAILQ
jgi:hypothetical protein